VTLAYSANYNELIKLLGKRSLNLNEDNFLHHYEEHTGNTRKVVEARTIHHQIVESGTDIDVVFELPGDLTLDCFLVEDEVGKYLSIEGERQPLTINPVFHWTGRFEKKIRLPNTANIDATISLQGKCGMYHITCPKVADSKRRGQSLKRARPEETG